LIYEIVNDDVSIRQGDIYYPLPLMTIDLGRVAVHYEGVLEESNWELILNKKDIVVHAPVKKVWGIVATQDCDALRTPFISFFEIAEFRNVTGLIAPETNKKWMSLITKKSRLFARWFYLPPDEKIGFTERMAINFAVVFQIARDNIAEYIQKLRKGRLNKIAYEHYRESIAQYYRRYPYDEWYPLNKEEFLKYKEEKGDVEPFEWQK
jgi:hypothetical protein